MEPDLKLPILYLIDSIVKNVGDVYVNLFSQSIVKIFIGAFEKVSFVSDKHTNKPVTDKHTK